MNRAEKKEQTRQAILASAKDLFEEQGFSRSSIRAIAAGAGVAAGTVLLHFEDKTDLLHSALFEDLERAIDQALDALPAAPLERQLDHVTRRLFAYYQTRPTLSRVLLKESLFARPPWAERFSSQLARVHAHLNDLAARAAKRGEISDDTDTDRLGAAYFSFYYFGLIAWVQGAHPDPIGMVDNLVRQHLDGVRAPSSKHNPRSES